MKIYILMVAALLLPSFIYAPLELPTSAFLRKGCDKLYTDDISNILTQFLKVSTKPQRKEYKEFMLRIKLHSDLGFKVNAFEKATTADIRARLRYPLTNYSACRSRISVNKAIDFQTPGPSKALLLPCETTYAVHVQNVVNDFKRMVSPETLKKYEEFMILLKHYEDLGFEITEFEKKTANVTTSRLRMPLVKYNTCRDSIIRIGDGGPIFPR